jgi:hypothetical protein
MSSLESICCARIPREALGLLAGLRTEPGVQAALVDRHAWIRWDGGSDVVMRTVLPIHGVVLFGVRDGQWHQFGQTLPAFDFPTELEYQPLAHVLFPAPVQPIPPGGEIVQAVELTLARDDRPRQTTALLCPATALAAWSDSVPTVRLSALQGVVLDGSILVLGANLPLLSDGRRFWGRDILVPLGFAPEPALSERTVKEVLGVEEDELLLWQPQHAEVVARDRFEPLSRAAIRLAASS